MELKYKNRNAGNDLIKAQNSRSDLVIFPNSYEEIANLINSKL
jgi:hypothetical protein